MGHVDVFVMTSGRDTCLMIRTNLFLALVPRWFVLGAFLAVFILPVIADGNAPVLDPVGDQDAEEDVELTFTVTASDADLESFTFSLSAGPEDNVPTGASIDQDTGDFTWTPDETQGGADYTFNVVVSDTSEPILTDSELITITVEEINTAPILDSVGNQTAQEDVELTFTATATDADLPEQNLTFTLEDGDSGTVPVNATITAGGLFSWTPDDTQIGSHQFDVVVTDDGVPDERDFETIVVTVEAAPAPNTAPTLNPIGAQNVNESALLAFTATAVDNDLPAQTLTFSLSNGTSGSIPSGAAITAGGLFTWVPSEAQIGVHTFDVVVTDDGDPNLSDFETITVTVNEVIVIANFVLNPGFEESGNAKPKRAANWTINKLVSTDQRICNIDRDGKPDLIYAHTEQCAHRFKLNKKRARYIQQPITLSTVTAGQTLTAAAYIDTDQLTNGAQIQVLITYADNSSGKFVVNIPRGTQPYRLVKNEFDLPKDVANVRLRIFTGNSKGTLLIDDVILTTDEVEAVLAPQRSVSPPVFTRTDDGGAVVVPLPPQPVPDLRGN